MGTVSQPSTEDPTFEGAQAGSPELRRLEIAMLALRLASFGLMYCTQALLPEIGARSGWPRRSPR